MPTGTDWMTGGPLGVGTEAVALVVVAEVVVVDEGEVVVVMVLGDDEEDVVVLLPDEVVGDAAGWAPVQAPSAMRPDRPTHAAANLRVILAFPFVALPNWSFISI